ncbi:glycosyl hydrolase [Cohnella phaseoli]|uniref:Alpha-L-rhamnosidase-like protein n=1 Tax=Cohnella phaseoli TaxID=456490 RepID=A0A3D9IBT0_9BACL|nr:glycosyl hydrolase [Cohnella phaseoli]RED59100.1 alpha-L-rhamnosidase-like protein [Cohnella phaseoli]
MSLFHDIEEQFFDPASEYRPQPFWFLNHDYKKEELEWQLEEMKRQGVGGVVLHSRHGKSAEYMSREYLDMLAFCTEECKKRGMEVWLYDEDNWPSGTFGGKLTRRHPEYRMRYLRLEEKRHEGGGTVRLDFRQEENNELIALLAYRVLQEEGERVVLAKDPIEITDLRGQDWAPSHSGKYVILACWECEIAEKVTFGAGYYLDTMNPEAVQAFVDVGYEPFMELREHFGHTIRGIFTDEPGLMIHDGFFGTEAIRTSVRTLNDNLPGYVLGWTRNLLSRFEAEQGYSLRPLLGALLYELEDASHTVREHYYGALTRWYVDAYHGTLSRWCETRGLAYIGHTLEEPLWGQARSQGNQTKVLQQFHYPGVDYLTKGIGTKENPYRILSVKCASSVARLEGKPRVVCEAFGASDHGYSMRDRRVDANFMAFLGVNLFIPHAFYYSFEGYRKTDFPQTEFYHAPHWEHYRSFADYTGRLCMLGSLGKSVSKILLVSPIHTVYQEMFRDGKAFRDLKADELFSFLSDRLIRNRLDFEYADEAQIERGTVSEEGLAFPNCEGGFPIVILPAMKVMGLETARKLLEFVRAGGMLIALDELPIHSTVVANDPELAECVDKWFPGPVRIGGGHACGAGRTLFMTSEQLRSDDTLALCEELRDRLSDEDPAGPWSVPQQSEEQVVITGKRIAGRTFTWLFNWSDSPAQLQYRPTGEQLEEWELETGQIRVLAEQDLLEFRLAPGQLRIVAPSPGDAPRAATAMPRAIGQQTVELSSEWDFEPADRNALILDRWEVTMNDRQARMPVRMPGQVNTFRKTIQVKEELIEALKETNGVQAEAPDRERRGVYLVLDDLKQEIQSHIGFLSRRRSIEIFVNGERLPALDPAQWQDRFYSWVDISPYLRSGDNTIEILTFSLLEPMPNFAYPAFLTGEFSVTGEGALTAPASRLSGYWTNGGYPYLSGKGVYRQSFDWALETTDGSDDEEIAIELEVEDIRETARLTINGKDAGVRLWPPYNWDVTKWVVPGVNRIELQIANTLDNLYGKSVLPSGIGGHARLTVRSYRA